MNSLNPFSVTYLGASLLTKQRSNKNFLKLTTLRA